MIDPVISLSRLKESLGDAHELGMSQARAKLDAAIERERADERPSRSGGGWAFRFGGFATGRFAGLPMAGALATMLLAIALVSNGLSPAASGNADEVAMRMQAQLDASLEVIARAASDQAHRRQRAHPEAKPPAPVFILPPANTVVAPDAPAPPPDDAAEPPTGPTGGVDDEEPQDDEETGEENTGDEGEDAQPGDSPNTPGGTGDDAPGGGEQTPAQPPAAGTSTAPSQGAASSTTTG